MVQLISPNVALLLHFSAESKFCTREVPAEVTASVCRTGS